MPAAWAAEGVAGNVNMHTGKVRNHVVTCSSCRTPSTTESNTSCSPLTCCSSTSSCTQHTTDLSFSRLRPQHADGSTTHSTAVTPTNWSITIVGRQPEHRQSMPHAGCPAHPRLPTAHMSWVRSANMWRGGAVGKPHRLEDVADPGGGLRQRRRRVGTRRNGTLIPPALILDAGGAAL